MKKRALTLLEIMIVIFLITLITGAIGYNMKGSLNRGKEMRTQQGIAQLQDLLLLCLEDELGTPQEIAANPAQYLKESGIAKNPDQLIKDGWGDPLEISYLTRTKNFRVTSRNWPKN